MLIFDIAYIDIPHRHMHMDAWRNKQVAPKPCRLLSRPAKAVSIMRQRFTSIVQARSRTKSRVIAKIKPQAYA